MNRVYNIRENFTEAMQSSVNFVLKGLTLLLDLRPSILVHSTYQLLIAAFRITHAAVY